MENEYEILKTNKEEKIERFLRRFPMIAGTISLSLALGLCAIKSVTKKNNTQIIKSNYDYSTMDNNCAYSVINGKVYKIELTYANPIKKVNSNGEITYSAPVGYTLDKYGICYRAEYSEVDDEKICTEIMNSINEDGEISYSAPEGYYLDKRTNKVLKRGK